MVTAVIVPQRDSREASMQRIMRLLVVAAMAATTVSVATGSAVANATGPRATGHRAAVGAVAVKTGLNGPSAFTFAPGGTIWYLERGTGEVHTLDPGSGADHRVYTISGVDGSGERGALGIALHPNWPKTPRVFVYVTRTRGGHLQNQLVRFTVSGGSGSHLRILLSAPASATPYHNGGRILFGPDRKLYVVIGDGHNSVNAQDRSGNLRGKILRLDTDGTAARGNPIGRIWSYGIATPTVRVRSAHPPPVGDGERPRVHRRDQSDRQGRQLRMGPQGDVRDREAAGTE